MTSKDMTIKLLLTPFIAIAAMICFSAPSLAQGANLPIVSPVTSCASLSDLPLDAIGGAGSAVTAASETTSDGIAVCSVTGTLAPQVNFQVLLPMQSWTQRYLQVGCGGLCGNITLRSGASDGCAVLNDGGFVMAATDMGHSGMGADWGQDAQKRSDFAYRVQHITALAAKELTRVFYGQDAAYSYFNGCSDGGREAVMEAIRYPGDFDGIVAGAPAMLFTVQNTLHHGWLARGNTGADGHAILTSAKLPLIHQGVMAACDAQDGVADGLLSQPALCTFDPARLICAAGADPATCLTKAEAAVVQAVYDGPRDAATGAALTPGAILPGSELNWQGVFVPDSQQAPIFSGMIAEPVLQNLAFDPARPDMALADLEFSTATLDALRPRHALFDATNPDLGAFHKAGGKLILWHGLADPHISPATTLAYYLAMQDTLGATVVQDFVRLYLLPGVGHCGGGQGPGKLDLLTAMMAWVENGAAPGPVQTASALERSTFGQPEGVQERRMGPPQVDLGVAPLPAMTRPVWPWPATALWSGNGDVTKAATWTQGPDAQIVGLRDWAGADFFAPSTPVE